MNEIAAHDQSERESDQKDDANRRMNEKRERKILSRFGRARLKKKKHAPFIQSFFLFIQKISWR
jgi:hypothetical protein